MGASGRARESGGQIFAALVTATDQVAAAADLSAVTAAVAQAAAGVMGPVGVMAGLRDASGQALVVAALHEVPPSVMCGNKTLPLAARLPMTDAVVTGRPVWMSGAAERARRYPELAARTPESYACGSLPLTQARTSLGVMCLIRMAVADGIEEPFSAGERAFAVVLAGLVGPAIGQLTRTRDDGVAEPRLQTGVFEWDPGSGRLWCTAAILRMHGQPCGADLGERLQVSPGQLAGFPAVLEKVGEGRDAGVISYLHPARDECRRVLEVRACPVRAARSEPRRVVGIVTEASSGGDDPSGRDTALHPVSGLVPGELSAVVAAAVTMGDFSRAAASALRMLPADGLLIAEQEADRIRVVTAAGLPGAARPRGHARIPAGAALACRVPVYAKSTRELLARFPHWQPVIAGLGNRAWAMLQLASSDGALAACLLACRPGWSPSGQDQARLLMAAGLLGPALDRCRAHDHQHRLITAMRPDPPATLPGLTIAFRYQPGTFGLGIGGDFCDAFSAPAGTSVLVIGDVQGHGPAAAGIADKLRTAIRAYVLDGYGPAQTLARASRFLADLNGEELRPLYATCCFLTFNPASGRVRASRAGHPQPILVTPAGPARPLSVSGGPPLGVSPASRYPASTCTIAPASTMLLYTDGLTERPGTDTEIRTKELLRQLDDNRTADPAAMLSALSTLNGAGPRYDDIAVLAARYECTFDVRHRAEEMGLSETMAPQSKRSRE